MTFSNTAVANALLCTVCAAGSPLMLSRPEGSLYRCPACDHCFTDPNSVPEPEDYGADYYDVKHRNWFENPNIALFTFIQNQIKKLKPEAAVLDVGCGRGDFLKFLRGRDRALKLTGIDFTTNQPADGITFIKGDALTHAFGQKFDAVITLAVIEHVADIHSFVKGLRALCANGGVVAIMTVNDRSVLYGVARLIHWFGLKGPFNRLYEKHHLNHFNLQSLRRLVEMHGLRVTTLHCHDIPLTAVDFEANSKLSGLVMRVGVCGIFTLGKLLGRTYLQTLVCAPV